MLGFGALGQKPLGVFASSSSITLTDTGSTFSVTLGNKRIRVLTDNGFEASTTAATTTLDTFNRADGAPGASWSQAISTYSVPNIVSNALNWPQFPSLYWNPQTFDQNQEVVVQDPGTVTNMGALLRLTNPNSGAERCLLVQCGLSGNGTTTSAAEAFYFTSGTGSSVSLGFSNGIMAATDSWMKAQAVGNKIYLYGSSNGTSWTLRQTWTIPAAGVFGSGYVGLFHQNNSAASTLDNFGGGALTADSVSSARIFSRPLSDTGTTQTSSLAQVKVIPRTLTDTGQTAAATQAVASRINRALTDNGFVAGADSVSSTRFFSRPISDTGTTQSSSLVAVKTITRTLTDTGTTNTTSSLAYRPNRALTDTGFTFSETLGGRSSHFLTDTGAAQTDSLARLKTIPRTLSDTGTTQTDSILRRPSFFPTDTGFSFSESLVRTAVSRALTDTGATFSASVSSIRIRPLTDTGTTQTDSLTRNVWLHYTLADTGLSFSEILDDRRSRFLTDTGITQTQTLISWIAQLAHPASDISTGTWQVAPLYPKVNEAAPGLDANYIYSAESPVSPDIAEMGLASLGNPGRTDGHVLRYRISKSAPGSTVLSLTVRLMQGATEIANWVVSDVSPTVTTYEQTLSSAQAAAITNYSDLRVKLEAVKV